MEWNRATIGKIVRQQGDEIRKMSWKHGGCPTFQRVRIVHRSKIQPRRRLNKNLKIDFTTDRSKMQGVKFNSIPILFNGSGSFRERRATLEAGPWISTFDRLAFPRFILFYFILFLGKQKRRIFWLDRQSVLENRRGNDEGRRFAFFEYRVTFPLIFYFK